MYASGQTDAPNGGALKSDTAAVWDRCRYGGAGRGRVWRVKWACRRSRHRSLLGKDWWRHAGCDEACDVTWWPVHHQRVFKPQSTSDQRLIASHAKTNKTTVFRRLIQTTGTFTTSVRLATVYIFAFCKSSMAYFWTGHLKTEIDRNTVHRPI